ncbi:MAG: hypothetical protein AAF322_17205 [Pseudomonadota bacterium]
MTETTPRRTLIDGHVHIHPGVDPGALLDAAAANMAAAARRLDLDEREGALLLTESAGVDAFAALPGVKGDWRVGQTGEPVSLVARRTRDGARLVIVAGRQIVTAEGIEAHGVGLASAPPAGRPSAATLQEIEAEGASPVLPWGFGKWSGARGRLVAELIETGPRTLALSDSGVRMAGSARPPLMAKAERAGRPVIAGTDPLPFKGSERRVGRFGFVADVELGEERPFAVFADWLRTLAASPPLYGRLERPLAFVAAQIAMQARKRFGRS